MKICWVPSNGTTKGPGDVQHPGHFVHCCFDRVQVAVVCSVEIVERTLNWDPGVSGNSRSRPFPGTPAFHSRSRKLWMDFSFPFPFTKVGNTISHSRSCSQKLGMRSFIPVPFSGMRSGIKLGLRLILYIFRINSPLKNRRRKLYNIFLKLNKWFDFCS